MSYEMPIPEEVRKRYLERRKRDVHELTEALQTKNFKPFIVIGHQLQGNALTFGYEELSNLGERLERAGLEADISSAEFCLIDYKNWLQKQGGK